MKGRMRRIMIEIKNVQKHNKEFWLGLDKHLSEKEFEKKIRDNQGYVIYLNSVPVGLLRYNLFWDNIPFCTMLFIDSRFRGNGYGRKLMEFWEDDMKSLSFGMVMTSTQVDEDAQHFYRKLGYKDSGGLLIRRTLEKAKALGYKAVLITGHPEYYPRFGFVNAEKYKITMLDGSNFDAFMALELYEDALNGIHGKWVYAPVFEIYKNELAKFNQKSQW